MVSPQYWYPANICNLVNLNLWVLKTRQIRQSKCTHMLQKLRQIFHGPQANLHHQRWDHVFKNYMISLLMMEGMNLHSVVWKLHLWISHLGLKMLHLTVEEGLYWTFVCHHFQILVSSVIQVQLTITVYK